MSLTSGRWVAEMWAMSVPRPLGGNHATSSLIPSTVGCLWGPSCDPADGDNTLRDSRVTWRKDPEWFSCEQEMNFSVLLAAPSFGSLCHSLCYVCVNNTGLCSHGTYILDRQQMPKVIGEDLLWWDLNDKNSQAWKDLGTQAVEEQMHRLTCAWGREG